MFQRAAALAALLLSMGGAQAAVPVNPDGSGGGSSGTLTFGTQPLATEFATAVLTGTATTYADNAGMDAGANTVDAATVTRQLPSTATVPPGTFSGGMRWNSAGLYVQSRPTTDGTNAAGVMVGFFQNNSGGDLTQVTITYDFNSFNVAAGEVPGFRAFWSFTGAPGSWTLLPGLSGSETIGVHTDNLGSTVWPAGGSLYILWADDNANGISDPSYTIDNLVVNGISTTVSCVDIVSGPVDLTVPERGSGSFSIMATGSPQNIIWYRSNDGGNTYTEVPGVITPTLTIASAAYPGDNGAKFFAIVSNSICMDTSAVATLTVQQDLTPPVAISVIGDVDPAIVRIAFSEPMDAATINENNFIVFPTGGDPGTEGLLTFGAVLAPDGTNATITTDPRIFGTNYSIQLLDVRDASSGNNLFDPNPTNYNIRPNILLIGFDTDNEWKYDINNGDRYGTGWELPGYDDAAWPSGPAGLGLDASANGVPIRTTLPYNANGVVSYYRRTFVFPAKTNGVTLQLRDVVEDGAIYFLNGQELHRTRMPAGNVTFATLANGAPDPTPVNGPINLSITNLLPGVNTIAVAVHQSSTTSTDVELAAELVANIVEFASGPPSIITQPQSQSNVPEGNNVTFSVFAEGGLPLGYHWLKGGNPIGAPDSSSLTLFSVSSADEGGYSVIVSNSQGMSTSQVATLTVTADTFAPVFVSAIAETNLTNITLTITDQGRGLNFETATNPANWAVALTAGGGDLTVESAVRTSPSNIVLTTSARTPMTSYTIVASEVVDSAVAQNPLTPGSRLVVATERMFGFGENWRYDESGMDLGTTWKDVGYNDSAWPVGAGVLAYETSVGPLTLFTNIAGGNGTNTVLSLTNQTGAGLGGTNITFFFRTMVNLTFDPSAAGNAVRVRSYIDDGAILYVNGIEQMRFNMTNGPGYTNLADVGSTEGVGGLIVSNLGGFVQGANLVAVEVHQNSMTSSDIAWAMEVEGLITTFGVTPGCPALSIAPGPGAGQATITWSGSCVLQEAPELLSTGTAWTDVAGSPSGSYTFSTTGEKRFFRLRP